MSKTSPTEFQKLMIERYTPSNNATYEEQGDFAWLMGGPEQYGNEDAMLSHAKKNPTITARKLNEYFDKITPDGLPPCAVDWEDEDDD